MFTLLRHFRPALTVALLAAGLAVGVTSVSAQSGASVQVPAPTRLDRVQTEYPFRFVGRVYAIDFGGVGSGTLIHRQTVLTAGHVVYDATIGFTTQSTFQRALYGNYQFQSYQIFKVAALSGYTAAVTANTTTGSGGTGTSDGENSLAAFAFDQAYQLLGTAPYDEDWANFSATPALLINPSNQFFVLGYPAETFDGLTQAYVVPRVPYTPVGTSISTGAYVNTSYFVEGGMSGGPILVETDDNIDNATVAADTVAGNEDTSGTATLSYVRVIDKTSQKFLNDAEFTNGLIKRVKVVGPATATRGTTVTYTVTPVFTTLKTDGSVAFTTRYNNLKLRSTAVAIQGQAGVTVKKTSNTTFDVTFSATTSLRPGTTVTLQAYFDGQQAAPGKSSKTITIR